VFKDCTALTPQNTSKIKGKMWSYAKPAPSGFFSDLENNPVYSWKPEELLPNRASEHFWDPANELQSACGQPTYGGQVRG
jgi:hypothetical protein